MQNLKPFLKTVTKTDTATTVAATLMLTVGTLAMFLTWGMLAMAAVFLAAPKAVVRMAAVGDYDPCAGRDDCAMRLDSPEVFERLAGMREEWYDPAMEFYSGPSVQVLVPLPGKVEAFCEGFERCLRTPRYLSYDIFGSPSVTDDYPEPFARYLPDTWGDFFSTNWESWGLPTEQTVYLPVRLFRIRQAPERYGFRIGYGTDPGQRVMSGQAVELPTLELVSDLYAMLQPSFGLGQLAYYPTGLLAQYQDQARQWEAAGVPFPVYYEALRAEAVTSVEQYRQLNGCGPTEERCRLLFFVPRKSKIDAYCQFYRDKGEPCLDRPVFANAAFMGFHRQAFLLLAPNQLAGLDWDWWWLVGPLGPYRLGSVWKEPYEDFYRFNLETVPITTEPFQYVYSLGEVREVYRALAGDGTQPAPFALGELAFVAYGGWGDLTLQEREARSWLDGVPNCPPAEPNCDAAPEPPEFRVIFSDDAGPYQAYTTGVAFGRMKVLTLEDFDQAARDHTITWSDFLAVDKTPFDITTPVAGIITGSIQLSDVSHVALRMARRGRPNAYRQGATAELEPWDGKLVRVEVTEREYFVREATAAEVTAWQDANRPRLKPPQPTNRTYRGLDRIREMTNEPTSRFSRFGGKASNLAKLYAFLPAQYQLEAFAIPFAYYWDFIRSSRINDSTSFPSACRFGSVTYEEFVRRMLASAEFQGNPTLRGQCLDAFYSYGRKNGRVDPALVRQIAARIQELWGDANNDGRDDATGKNIQVRFRSSSNMEDGVEFNGAGLYESTTVCLRDQLDDDTVATCDPDEDHEETIERALRKVWMSTWLPRAFEEREYWQLPQDQAAMAVLVNTGTPDERDNGVAFTGDPTQGGFFGHNWRSYDLYVQPQEVSVVSPAEGKYAEIDRVFFGVKNNRIDEWGVRLQRVRPSSELPRGQYALSDANLQEMGEVMFDIDQRFPLQRDPYPSERVLLDMEFKHLPSGQLVIKQVRPFLIGQAINFTGTPALPAAPSDLSAEASPTQVVLRWQATAADDTLAMVERSFTGTVWQAVATMRSSVRSYTDTTVRPGSTYRYRVRLENHFGLSEPSGSVTVSIAPPAFRRGDADARGSVDLTDAIFTLTNLFLQGPPPPCDDAADANDDGGLDVSDAVRTLLYLFSATVTELAAPGATTAGPDPTADGLDCARYPAP